MPYRVTFLGLCLFLLLPLAGLAQEDADPPKPPKLFQSDTPLDITLHGPWDRIMDTPSDPRRYPGRLAYTDINGQSQSFDIEITTRGLTRRDKVCDMPPLKLWFDKDLTKGTAFRGQASLKMVTHCDTNRRFQHYYVKEYLAYRVYNQVTSYSFGVRALMVTYVDTGRDDDREREALFGFLIEDVDDVAKRHDLEELEIPRIRMRRLDPVETSNFMVFQYLIGNLDWSALTGPDPVECCHNAKLIGAGPEASPVFPIPYDLDSSGLVDAHYAMPPSQLRVRRITQRLYRGYCVHNDQLPAALDRFRSQQAAIMDLFHNEPQLTGSSRSKAIRYVEGFFSSIEDPGYVQKRLVDKCRE